MTDRDTTASAPDLVLAGGEIDNDDQLRACQDAMRRYAAVRRERLGLEPPPGWQGTGFETEDAYFEAANAWAIQFGFQLSAGEREDKEEMEKLKDAGLGGATAWANAMKQQRAMKGRG